MTLCIADTASSKSQIAIEYCYKFRQSNPAANVFWIYCATAERFKQAYQDLARELSLPGWNEPTADIMKIVSRWLSVKNHVPWLMILDNADHLENFFSTSQSFPEGGQSVPLASYLPQSSSGFVLVTTRDSRLGRRLTNNHPILVLPLELQEARQLLRSKLPDRKAEVKDLADEDDDKLLHELEGLPLAITQAAAFISENSISVAEYVSMLQQDDSELATLLDQNIPDLRRDPEASSSVLQTWKLSFDQIQRQQKRAAEMLSLMAFFDRQSIPKFFLRRDEEKESEFVIACGVLQAYSLISVVTAGNFSLHRLVRLFITAWLDIRGESETFQERALQILSREFPPGRYENWKTCQLLAPHVQVILSHHPVVSQSYSLHLATLLYHLAGFEKTRGRLQSALQACMESCYRRRDLKGESEIDVLCSLDLLASILRDQRRYDEAETMQGHTLVSKAKLLGKEHPETLISMSEFGKVLSAQGKHDEAETFHRGALILSKKILGDAHPETLKCMHHSVRLLRSKNRYNEAEKIHRQSLEFCEKLLGKEHPSTLTSQEDLAVVLWEQGRYDEAEMMYRQNLELREKVLGKEHPDTLISMHHLADALRQLRKYDEAEMMHRQELELGEKVLGKEHLGMLMCLFGLALVLQDQGKYGEAEMMHRQTLELLEKVWGKEHPHTLTILDCIATVSRLQGKDEEVKEFDPKSGDDV